jgi:hypothetical protein
MRGIIFSGAGLPLELQVVGLPPISVTAEGN